MNFGNINCLMSNCPNCKADKGGVHMQYMGYKHVNFEFCIYYSCSVCHNYFEYVLKGPVKLKDKPL